MGPRANVPRALRAAVAARLPGARLESFSLDRYVSNPKAPLRAVLCPFGSSVAEEIEFLREVRRRALWPLPGADLWGAIAGLRGTHDAAPRSARLPPPARAGRRTALLLEGDVTFDRARRAASSGAPRDWIVEKVQRVRIEPRGLDQIRRLGIRWAVLDPVEVIGLAASPAFARARSRWARWLPEAVPVWVIARRRKSEVRGQSRIRRTLRPTTQ
ncbi:MAG TPA: hypothetical protein VGK08_03895 [Thermoanaerobaculia bacterium]